MTPASRAATLACLLAGCRAPLQSTGGDAAVEGGPLGVREGGTVGALEAAPPPDDVALPSNTEELQTRARHLLEAVAQDDAALASDILFPRDGWLATRDAPDPGKDWDAHVATPFHKAVHVLSRRHRDLQHAEVVSLELGSALVEATPRKHGWKKPLWTVSGSRLTFVADGHTRTLSIREMVAWRGAWYVTRLR